jgi:NitT/TauT family transport system substrate-binding protein
MKRLEMLAGTAAALAAAAAPGAAQTLPVIRLGTGLAEEKELVYYAQDRGFFKQAGLDVQIDVMSDGGAATAAAIGGALDMTVTNTGSVAAAHARGLPLYLVSPGALYSTATPIAYLVTAPDSPIRSAKDLAGKTIGVTTLRDMIQAAGMGWIDKNGGDAKTAVFFEIPLAQMAGAIERKRLDAAIVVEPRYTDSKAGYHVLGTVYDAVAGGKPFITSSTIANKAWADANPALVTRFVAAMRATAQWANKNPLPCGEILAKYSKVAPDIIAQIPRLTWAETLVAAQVQPVIDITARYGMLPRGFPASELFTVVH